MKPLYQEKHNTLFFRRRDTLDFIPHLHNAVELVLLLKGQSTVIYGGSRLSLRQGDLFIAFPGQVHGYENSRNCDAMVLVTPFNSNLSHFRDIFKEKLPTSPVLAQGSWEHTNIAHMMKMALQEKAKTPPLMQGYVLLILGKLLPLLCLKDAPQECADALQSILVYLNEHYTEPLSRKDIANAVGYTESYISHIFSDTLHTTLTDYIAALRLEDATHLLTNTAMTISQISVSLGFGSIRSFNRVFLHRMHQSPAAFRAAAKTHSPI